MPVRINLACSPLLAGLEHLKALTDSSYRLLIFLVRNPVMPITALATFLDAPFDEVESDLHLLHSHGLA